MQMECGALYGQHQQAQLYQYGWDRKVQPEANETARVAIAHLCMVYGDELERVEVVKYLSWFLAHNNNNAQAMQANLTKARKSWG
jgi:hypothetical protein